MRMLLAFLTSILIGCSSIQYKEGNKDSCENVRDCVYLFQEAVSDNWKRPEGARNKMQVHISLSLSTQGEILSINVVKPSGFEAFDLSAKEAIEKASPFTEIQGLKETEYDKTFRKFIVRFRPEDLEK